MYFLVNLKCLQPLFTMFQQFLTFLLPSRPPRTFRCTPSSLPQMEALSPENKCSMYRSLIQSAETIGSHTLSPFMNIFAQHHWAYFEPGILCSILRKIQTFETFFLALEVQNLVGKAKVSASRMRPLQLKGRHRRGRGRRGGICACRMEDESCLSSGLQLSVVSGGTA